MPQKNFYLILLACMALLIMPSSALSSNFILIHSDEGGKWVDNNYTWSASGIIRGKIDGSISWIEHGWKAETPRGEPQLMNAYAEGNITLKNGKIVHWRLGTPDNPYVFQKTIALQGGIFQYYMNGDVYLNGKHIGYMNKIATGTWDTMILLY